MRRAADLSLGLEIRHATSPGYMDDNIVECWVAIASAECGSDTVQIGSAVIYRMENGRTFEPSFELDNISYDLGVIAEAVYLHDNPLTDDEIWPGANYTLLVADRVALDPAWRGRGLGPALVIWAAELLRGDGIFLKPVPVRTARTPSGEIYLDYDRPRGGSDAKTKVIRAWRRAGFKKLAQDVMWRDVHFDADSVKALRTFERFEKDLQTSHGLAWFRRQLGRTANPS